MPTDPLWKRVKPGVVKPSPITKEREIKYLYRMIQLLRERIKRGEFTKEQAEKALDDILAKFVLYGRPDELKDELGELEIVVDQI